MSDRRKIKRPFLFLLGIFDFFSEGKILSSVIKKWKPDVIHTLGLYPASFFYLQVKKGYKLDNTWVVTLRGGPEFALERLKPERAKAIKEVLQACDQLIADNKQNYDYAKELGIDESKLSPLGVVPGTGGVDVDALSSLRKEPPSKQRLILWPKAYECPASKSLPVYEALRLCWDKIKPCEIYMTAMIPETHMWFETLPDEIKKSCHCMDRIPRKELLELMARSRVLLSPSLIDGIPNSLYEAMATGAFPIVSPIETLQGVVFEKENVLFARNLYPHEIAEALARAMSDDALVDAARGNNLKLVKKLADRDIIREKVESYYRLIAFKT